jgi:hypothetical protein
MRLADGHCVTTLGFMAPRDGRGLVLRVRMNSAERKMVQRLADVAGLTASDIVRQFVRREYAATFGAEPKPRRQK